MAYPINAISGGPGMGCADRDCGQGCRCGSGVGQDVIDLSGMQMGSTAGVVVRSKKRGFLPGVEVVFEDAYKGFRASGTTDSKGQAVIKNLPARTTLKATVVVDGKTYVKSMHTRPDEKFFDHNQGPRSADRMSRTLFNVDGLREGDAGIRLNGVMVAGRERLNGTHFTGGRMNGLSLADGEVSYARIAVIDKRGRPIGGAKIEVRGEGANVQGATDSDGMAVIAIGKPVGTHAIVFVYTPEIEPGQIPPGLELVTVPINGRVEVVRSTLSIEPWVTTAEAISVAAAALIGIFGYSLYKQQEDVGVIAMGVSSSILAGSTMSVISRYSH